MAAEMAALKAGDNMADFPDYFRALATQDGSQVALSNFKGAPATPFLGARGSARAPLTPLVAHADKKTMVVFFYPKDDTPGCTKEACALRDSAAHYETNNIVVLGISKDTAESHQKFISKYHLPFTLLSENA